MKNFQERYGRQPSDSPCLINEISVIGKRSIFQTAKNILLPHSLKDFQVIYVETGALDIYIDGEIHMVKENDLIIIRPYEVMTYLQGTLPKGTHYFAQINNQLLSDKIDETLLFDFHEKLRHNHIRVLRSQQSLAPIFENLLKEHRKTQRYNQNYVACETSLLFIHLIRLMETQVHDTPQDKDHLFLKKINRLIDSFICSALSVKELAQQCQISENQLRLQFKRILKRSPQEYMNQKRIEYAKRLLCESNDSITKISLKMGFSSSQYFSLFFKKHTSLTPFEFRTSMRTCSLSTRRLFQTRKIPQTVSNRHRRKNS